MSDYQPVDVVRAVALYSYNTSAREQVLALFGDAHPDYIAEKVLARLDGGFFGLFGALDGRNQEKLVAAALARYGCEAVERRLALERCEAEEAQP